MDYRALVNPTHSTAKATAIALAAAGDEDARRMVAELNLTDSVGISGKKRDAIIARYAAVSGLLEAGAYRSLLDIGCGYSPR
ncbi:MAG: hypothetical protein IJ048_12090, partial [Clostridia bacterium]|nr:hypothetical protein [Clostridia bacterium]